MKGVVDKKGEMRKRPKGSLTGEKWKEWKCCFEKLDPSI